MALTRPASSSGSPFVEMGSRDVGDRRATERAVFSSGARPLPTTIQTAIAMKGRSRQRGCRTRKADEAASSVRTAVSWPTVMMSGPAGVE